MFCGEYSNCDFDKHSHFTYVMDYQENGSLQQLIENERLSLSPHEYDNTAKQIILSGIAYGMMQLHLNGICHCKLTPNNILLDENFFPMINDAIFSPSAGKRYAFLNGSPSWQPLPYIPPEYF